MKQFYSQEPLVTSAPQKRNITAIEEKLGISWVAAGELPSDETNSLSLTIVRKIHQEQNLDNFQKIILFLEKGACVLQVSCSTPTEPLCHFGMMLNSGGFFISLNNSLTGAN